MKNIMLILTCLIMNFTWAQKETTTIYLIRHAEKADDGTADPGISEAGKERTKKLGEYFKDKNIGAYYTTQYKRAKETALWTSTYTIPYPSVPGTSIDIRTKVYDPMAFSLKQVAAENKGKSVVVVGHSNTIPTLINNFIGEKKYPDMMESEYGNLYIVKISGDRITHELVQL